MGIHNYEKKYQSALQKVHEAAITPKNKELILRFVNDLMLEGISNPRQVRYLSTIKLLAELLQKDFDTATKEDIKQIVGMILQRTDYSPWTKHTYKVMLRRFYKWLEGTENYPERVAWISIRISKSEMPLPSEGDLLTEADIQKLLHAADHPRDKAFVSMLWESGCRVGELGNLKLKNVAFDEQGTMITVLGKTGARKIRLIASTPHLSTYINTHPSSKTSESPLWLNIGPKNHNKAMAYATIQGLLRRLFQRAGVKKRHNPHLFRHSRATFMAHHLTEFQMNHYFGWTQGSRMPSTYVHMSGRDVDNAIFKMNGMQTTEKKEESQLLPRKCVRCDTINSSESKHCNKCGGILDIRYAVELEEKKKEQEEIRSNADALMNMLMKDPDVQKVLLEKIAQLKA
ncbi:MAG: tyrosine-type recombinase/integrase [Nanoarchaeota archaeon]